MLRGRFLIYVNTTVFLLVAASYNKAVCTLVNCEAHVMVLT